MLNNMLTSYYTFLVLITSHHGLVEVIYHHTALFHFFSVYYNVSSPTACAGKADQHFCKPVCQ